MAATDAKPIPLKGTAYRVTFPIFDADGDLVSSAAGLDSEVSKDGAAFNDCTNEATEIGSSGLYYLDLTADEMNADTVAVVVKTSTSGAKTTPIVLYPAESADIPVNVTAISGDSTAADNLEAACDGGTYNVGGGAVVAASVTAAVTAGTVSDKTGYALSSAGIQAIWDALTSALTAVGSIGKRIADNLDATITSRSTYAGGAVASVTNPVTLTGDYDAAMTAAQPGDEMDLVNAPNATAVGAIQSGLAGVGDIPTPADIRTEMEGVGSSLAGVKERTDRLPDSPAETGEAAAAVTGLAIENNVQGHVQDGLTAQGYSAARAGYLDTLNGLVAAIWVSASRTLTAISDSSGVTTLLGRLTDVRAGLLDNLNATISSRSTLTAANVRTQADAALADYDGPTKAELDAAESNIRGADGDTLKTISDQVDGISAASIAAAVWNRLTSALTTTGSIGAWLLSEIAATRNRVNALSASIVTVTSPVALSGDVEIVQGDDYSATDGRSLLWRDSGGTWLNLTGATVTVAIGSWTKAGTVLDAGTSAQGVQLQLTAAETAALDVGRMACGVRATGAVGSGGRVATLVRATATVVRRVVA